MPRFDELLQCTPVAGLTRRVLLKRVTAGVAGLAAFGLIGACRGQQEEAPTPQPAAPQATPVAAASPTPAPAAATPAPAEGKYGGEMIVTGHHEIASLHPDDAGPTVHWVIVTQIHNGMIELDENYQLELVLAESYDVAEDGMTYTFKLRDGVKFHDGEIFDSGDVKHTFEWYMNPDSAAVNAVLFRNVDRVETPDNLTVIIKMKQPDAPFLVRAATTFILPEHHHGKVGKEGYASNPIGTGPFKLKEWRAAEYTTVEAFEDHFRGRPYLDLFTEKIVPEASVRAIMLETGEADSAVWPLVPEDNLRFAEDPTYTVFRTSSLAVNHFPLNNEHPVLGDKAVRQAMMHAIDRQKVIDDIFLGTAVIATANLSPALTDWYEPDVKQYPYDLELAKKILEDAGWVDTDGDGIREKNGVKCSFTCTTITGDQVRRPEAEVVQQYLKAVGIDMQLAEAPTATILEKMRSGEMDASLFNWTYGGGGGDPDAAATLRSDAVNNFSHYKNPRMDELLDNGIKEVDPEKRKAIYSEAQKLVAEDVPFLYMMFWDWFNIFTKRIKGLPETALAGSQLYRKAYLWWIEE